MSKSPLPKLVCLPGLDGSGVFFAGLVSALADKAETIALSYPASGPQSYEALADHLKRQVPQDDYVLLGESFAGPLAVLLAKQATTKLRGLILTATFARNPFPLLGGLLGSHLPAFLTEKMLPVMEATLFRPGDHELTWKVYQAVSRLDPEVLKGRIKAVTSCNVQKALASLDMPILYLQGSNDKLISSVHGTLMARTARNLHIAKVSTPHFVLQYDTGTTVQDHILPFLKAVA